MRPELQDLLATPDHPGRDITRAREALGEALGLGRPLSCLELADALELTGSNARRREYVEQLEHETRDTSGPLRVAVRAMLEGFVPAGLAPTVARALPSDERMVLVWLAEADGSLYGECNGPALERLQALGLAKVAPARDGLPTGHELVTLTEGGRAVAVCLAVPA